MRAPAPSREEDARLAALRDTGLLDTPPEERFDRITRVAAALVGAPVALVNLVDEERTWVKSRFGLQLAEMPRHESFCSSTIQGSATLVVPDAAADGRFATLPSVTDDPRFRFYAGHPLQAPGGARVGTLCVLDTRPRELDAETAAALEDLASWAEVEIRARSLAEAGGRLRAVLQHVAEGIVTFGADGRVRSANPAAEEVFGSRGGGLLGRSVGDLLAEPTWEQVRPRLLSGEVLGTRRMLRGRRADGSEFPLELVITEAEIGSDQLFIGIGSDVSERVAGERRLRQSEHRQRAIFEHAPVGMSVTDMSGRALQFNESLVELLRETPLTLVGNVLPERVHPDDREPAVLDDVLTGRLRFWRGERRIRRGDGSYVWVELSTSRLGERSGETHLLSTYVDITERKEVDRLKDEFVSVVGHELRTPLTSIRGSIGLVTSGVLGEVAGEARDMLRVATDNADRLSRLIDDILDVERMRSGRAPLDRRPVRAQELIDATLTVVRPVAEGSGVRIEAEAEAAEVYADADRIVQALTNLVGNAVKFSPAAGVVTVRATADGDELRFAVSDHGRGIPPDKLERIFERFMQVDASDARERGGTGLGLAIARAIAEQHRGRVWAQSQVGQGSTFTLAVPLEAAPEP